MPTLIHMTLAYSNAVLVALLPVVSDFSKKLELPVPVPITTNHVEYFKCFKNSVGGHLILTNGYEFWYSHGHVEGFEGPGNWFTHGGEEFIGKSKISSRQAADLVRQKLRLLGIDDQELLKGAKLKVTYPSDKKYPFFDLAWDNPDGSSVTASVDGRTKSIVGLFLHSRKLYSKPLVTSVKPEYESDYRKKVSTNSIPKAAPPPELK